MIQCLLDLMMGCLLMLMFHVLLLTVVTTGEFDSVSVAGTSEVKSVSFAHSVISNPSADVPEVDAEAVSNSGWEP